MHCQTPAPIRLSYLSSFPSPAASSLNFSSPSLSPGRLFSVPPLAAHPPVYVTPRLPRIPSVSQPLSRTFSCSRCSVFRLLPLPSSSLLPNQSHMLERKDEREKESSRGWTGLCCMFLSAVQCWSQACVEMWRCVCLQSRVGLTVHMVQILKGLCLLWLSVPPLLLVAGLSIIPPSRLSFCHLHLSILLTPLYSSPLCFPLVAVTIYTFSFLLHPHSLVL